MSAPTYCVQPIPFRYMVGVLICIILALILCAGAIRFMKAGVLENEPGLFITGILLLVLVGFSIYFVKKIYSLYIRQYFHAWDLMPIVKLGVENVKYDDKVSLYKQSPKNVYIVSRCRFCGEARYQRYKLK